MSETYNTHIGDNAQNVTVTTGKNINQVTAKKIENSFNRAKSAEEKSDEIKTLLQTLVREFALIAENLSPDEAEEGADSLETLTKEVVRETPRREWWELSAKGVVAAATAVGDVGLKAIALTEQLGSLLGF